MRGKLITLEGPEGAGKTLLASKIVNSLRERNYRVTTLREPGGTSIGETVRSLIQRDSSYPIYAETELFLFEAARAQFVRQIIRPTLERGEIVLIDRYMDSTTAYQGYARGLSIDSIERMNALAVGDCAPDLTLLLDIEPSVGLARIRAREELSRIEKEELAFHNRLRKGYLELAAKTPERMIVLDAQQSPDYIFTMAKINIRKKLDILL